MKKERQVSLEIGKQSLLLKLFFNQMTLSELGRFLPSGFNILDSLVNSDRASPIPTAIKSILPSYSAASPIA